LSWSWCKSPDIGLPSPDLTIFLSLSPETAKSRSGFGNERYETPEIQGKVREVFGKMGQECEEGVWREVSAEGGVEEVEERVRHEVEQLWVSGRLDGEVKKLWVD
jgi:dTMP kinase